jgi:hypothetical protein
MNIFVYDISILAARLTVAIQFGTGTPRAIRLFRRAVR